MDVEPLFLELPPNCHMRSQYSTGPCCGIVTSRKQDDSPKKLPLENSDVVWKVPSSNTGKPTVSSVPGPRSSGEL